MAGLLNCFENNELPENYNIYEFEVIENCQNCGKKFENTLKDKHYCLTISETEGVIK